MSIRFKLFAAFFLFILLPFCLSGLGAYWFVSDFIEKKYSQQAELTLRALSQNVEFIFGEMNKVTDSTIASTALQELLDNRGYDLKHLTETDYLELNQIQKSFRELLINHPSVSFAFMYTLHDERILPIFAKGNFAALPFEEFQRQPLYQSVLERDGLPRWVGPYEYPRLTGADPVFTQIRLVKDIDTLRDKGILLVQMKQSGLENLFRYFRYRQEEYDTRFLIVNEQGLILYDSAGEMGGERMQAYTTAQLHDGGGYVSDRLVFAEEESILSSIPVGEEQWRLVSLTSWHSLSREITAYAKVVAAITGLCLLSALAFLMFSVNRIAKSIVRIVRSMRRVEDGELHIRVREEGRDELSLLAQGLNSLIERVHALLGKVKQEQQLKNKAELRVLQAQIKPHFLFNTLESINVLAARNEGRKVSEMVQRLGVLLRISFQEQERIPLRQELAHLRSYLDIQMFRFEDLFAYELDVPEELLGCYLPKLTLQPLVENALQHGFEGIVYKGLIRIRGELEKNQLVLYVEDNGIGMDAQTLSRFSYIAEDVGDATVQPSAGPAHAERRGLGLRSVADRIRIEYGSAYGLWICSHSGRGTTIKCVLPNSPDAANASNVPNTPNAPNVRNDLNAPNASNSSHAS
ncbi:sensor histidine kinase [Xylanibacillus composti]|uniref:Sensor histidine kinase YesM n=1 Tax=Xylanibacillus composti TaxID=1572762 RepID=A0A8J4H720_9BACL|nr:sensor histidine kinase [Xylanibacillus composti]MDT9726491.1 sensor histidine kinase [Xylanibacillus composti]GIQ69938.1 sensor histidine kinase YesM [Xylanibacillus composti]